MVDAAKDFAAGTLAGMLSKVFEFPFDTIKVRLQAPGSTYTGIPNCIARMRAEEGIWSFYKGVMAPVAGAMAENAVVFTAYGTTHDAYNRYWGLSRKDDSMTATIVSGLVAGAAVAHVLTPVELIKCRMQLDNLNPPNKRQYVGVVDCLRQTMAKQGPKALFDGHTATLAREIPGNAAWFASYRIACQALTPAGKTKDDLPVWKLALAGGCGGVMYWTAFFPADVAKTRLQTDPEFLKLGLFRTIGVLAKEGGMGALYSGWGITMIRAFPANALIFATYEVTVKALDKIIPRAE